MDKAHAGFHSVLYRGQAATIDCIYSILLYIIHVVFSSDMQKQVEGLD